MFLSESMSISSILNKSPFYSELSIKEREKLILELMKKYPQLYQDNGDESDLGI